MDFDFGISAVVGDLNIERLPELSVEYIQAEFKSASLGLNLPHKSIPAMKDAPLTAKQRTEKDVSMRGTAISAKNCWSVLSGIFGMNWGMKPVTQSRFSENTGDY